MRQARAEASWRQERTKGARGYARTFADMKHMRQDGLAVLPYQDVALKRAEKALSAATPLLAVRRSLKLVCIPRRADALSHADPILSPVPQTLVEADHSGVGRPYLEVDFRAAQSLKPPFSFPNQFGSDTCSTI